MRQEIEPDSSDTSVYDPVMSACEAMIAARVPSATALARSISGSIWKKGFISGMAASAAESVCVRIHAPYPR